MKQTKNTLATGSCFRQQVWSADAIYAKSFGDKGKLALAPCPAICRLNLLGRPARPCKISWSGRRGCTPVYGHIYD